MNFSIHIDTGLAEDLATAVKKSGKKRNALINEALREFLRRKAPRNWPKEVSSLAGAVKDLKPFEEYRRELGPADEDPLA